MIDAKKVSLSNQVFEKLEEAVLNGYYPQGSHNFGDLNIC